MSRYNFRSLGLLFVLNGLFPACLPLPVFAQHRDRATPSAPLAYQPNTVIGLETHACLGTCPVYAIQIESTGKAVTVGLQYTPSKGPFTVQILREEMDGLNKAFTEANFCQLKDSYTSKGNSGVSDLPGTYLSFRCGETLKRVYDYYGTPAVVRDLERQVQQAAALESFLFSDQQTIETKFANGLKPDSKEAQTFLLEAVQWKDEPLVQYLLKRGVDPEAPLLKTKYESRSGPLVRAVLTNHAAISRLLVNYGADVQTETNLGNATLLIDAAREQGSAEMLSALVELGSEVNASDAGGSTALMYAAMRLRPDLTRLLLKAGANKNVRNQQGLTALDYAQPVRACGESVTGGLNTVALEDDPDYRLCDRAQTIALLK